MPAGQVLEFSGVTKHFGAVTAVDGLSARIEPGAVTGFLGPNGAGKTTTLRILLGLVRATAGTATVGGSAYAKLSHPLQTVGAVLEASSFHPGRTAANHLRVYARAAAIANSRVDEVLGLVGLADAAGRKVGGFSLGMRQRLGLAYALLGDPGVLVLDEPANGLDPEGIRWMRGFLRQLAREGRTVLVSSHLLTEVQQTVDSIVVISRGRLVFQGALADLADPAEYATVVDAPDRARLTGALDDAGVAYEVLRSGLTVRGLDTAQVGAIAAASGVALSSLQRRGPALEEVFLELVSGERVHTAPPAPAATGETAPEAAEETAAEAPAATEETATEEKTAEETTAGEPEESAPVLVIADAETEPATATFAVAGTGIIDIIPSDPAPDEDPPGSPVEGLPEDADPDVEAVAEIDEELSADDIAPTEHHGESEGAGESEASDEAAGADHASVADQDGESGEAGAAAESDDDSRPFDDYEKTDSDHDADAFFAAFDTGEGEASAADPAESDSPLEDGGGAAEEGGGDADHAGDDEGGDQR